MSKKKESVWLSKIMKIKTVSSPVRDLNSRPLVYETSANETHTLAFKIGKVNKQTKTNSKQNIICASIMTKRKTIFLTP